MTRGEQVEAIERETRREGYKLTTEQAEIVLADLREKGWSQPDFAIMSCWWDAMESASLLVRGKHPEQLAERTS